MFGPFRSLEMLMPEPISAITPQQLELLGAVALEHGNTVRGTTRLSFELDGDQIIRMNGGAYSMRPRALPEDIQAAVAPFFEAGEDWLQFNQSINVLYDHTLLMPGESQTAADWHFDGKVGDRTRNLLMTDNFSTLFLHGILRGANAKRMKQEITQRFRKAPSESFNPFVNRLIADGDITETPGEPYELYALDEYHLHGSPINRTEEPIERRLVRVTSYSGKGMRRLI